MCRLKNRTFLLSSYVTIINNFKIIININIIPKKQLTTNGILLNGFKLKDRMINQVINLKSWLSFYGKLQSNYYKIQVYVVIINY